MHKILARPFGVEIHTYGALLSLSILVGTGLLLWLGRRRGYPAPFLVETTTWMLVASFLGARLAYVAENLPHYLGHPLSILNFREGGIAVQGGIAAGVLAVAWLFQRQGIPWRNGLDLLAAPVLAGMALGRVGCLMEGCCYGKLCPPGWGVVYPAGSLPLGVPLGPRYPVQLYETGLDLLLLAALLGTLSRPRFAGQVAWLMVAGYGLVRGVAEVFREGPLLGPLTPAQWVSLFFVAVGGLGLAGVFGRPPVAGWPEVRQD
jgi:phosphatidylglycerol:prolipoprotein diacylglycerol transferase